MIELRVAGEFLDVKPGTGITLKLVNPVFVNEIGYGTHSFKFTLPWTSKNRRLLGFPGLMTASGTPGEIDAQLYYRHAPLFVGRLRVHGADPDRQVCEVSLTTGNSALASTLKGMNLREIDHGGLRILSSSITGQAVYELAGLEPPPAPLSIEVNGSIYLVSSTPGWASEYDALIALAAKINADPSNQVLATVSSGPPARLTITSDGAGLPFLIDVNPASNTHIWVEISYVSSGTQTMDDVTAHMASQSGLPAGTAEYVFPTEKNEGFYAGKNADYLDHVNLYDPVAGAYIKNTITAGQKTRNTCIPFPQLGYILANVFQAAGGYAITGSFVSSDDFSRVYVHNNVALDQIDSASGVNYYKQSFDLADHMPDLSGLDVIRETGKLFNLAVDVDENLKQVEIFPRADIFSAPEKDWRHKTLLPYQVQYPSPDDGHEYAYQKDDTDELFASQAFQADGITIGGGGKKVTSSMAPIFINSLLDPINSQSWSIPNIDQPGNTSFPEVGTNNFKARLMLYHGLQPNGSSNNYPAASNSDRVLGGKLSGWGLKWKGEYGIYETLHKAFDDLRDQAPEGAFQVQLGLADLLSLQWVQKYRVRVIEGEAVVILKEIDVTIDDAGIRPAKVKVIKV